jgi:cyclohexa-1,5-dienecarbonyl-CoA hydratase
MSANDEIVKVERLEDGQVWRLLLNTPKANILDGAKCAELARLFAEAAVTPELKAIVVEGEGPHFSFGASVPEHLPGKYEDMLHGFHGMFHKILDCHVPLMAAVRGQCLGGGLELVMVCHRIFASPDAMMGQPEIVLGVLPPVASVALADRVGRGWAEDLCITGRSIDAATAHRIGLVDDLSDDPWTAARSYIREHLLPKSASSLRHAVRAVRTGYSKRFRKELARVEKQYIKELMQTEDAREGLDAFMAKRKPNWKNR